MPFLSHIPPLHGVPLNSEISLEVWGKVMKLRIIHSGSSQAAKPCGEWGRCCRRDHTEVGIQCMSKDSSKSRTDTQKSCWNCTGFQSDLNFLPSKSLKWSTIYSTLHLAFIHPCTHTESHSELEKEIAQTLDFSMTDLLLDSIISVSNSVICSTAPEIKVCVGKHGFIPLTSEKTEKIFLFFTSHIEKVVWK